MKRKFTAITLLLALLLVSCGETGSSTDTTKPNDTTATPVENESPFEEDNLPADLDLGGKTINILIEDYNGAYVEDMYAEEATGNRLTDAVYHVITGV